MNIFIEYLIVFFIVYIFNYFILSINNQKKKKKKNTPEFLYLMKLYGIKIKNINYNNYMLLFALINTFIMDTTYIIVMYLIHNMLLKILLGIIILALLIIICYGLLARYFLWKEGKKDV